MKSFSDISALLAQREAQHLTRKRVRLESAQGTDIVVDGQHLTSFCSNDYLGLANHPDVKQAAMNAIEQYGVGSGASHMVNGHHAEHDQLEKELAQFMGREAALVFSTGYMANMGTMAALLSRHDTVIQDKLNHASLIDGAQISQANMLRFAHSDLEQLAHQLNHAKGKKLIAVDGVFSMDGDCSPLKEISALAKEHQAWLMVDDAHGVGTLGPKGAGLVAQQGLSSEDVPLVVGTLGKAFGTSGAFVAGDQTTIDYILQFARTYIYTTAAPPAIAAATRTALSLVKNGDDLRESLNARINQLRQGVHVLGLNLMPSHTAIQPILIGQNERAMALSQRLKERGFLVTAIRPPTVPEGTARLRVTLSASHSQAQVDSLLNTLEDLL